METQETLRIFLANGYSSMIFNSCQSGIYIE